MSLFNLHKGFCVLSHALLCNRTPAGWRSVYTSKLVHFAITPVGYESLMVHQGLVKTQVLFLYHCGILRAIARVALQLNPCGLTLRFCDIQGTPKDTCTFGEKEHTSKRVSIIAPDNAISKAQCATLLRYYANVVCYAPPHLHQRKSPINTGLQAHRTSSFVTQNHPLTQALTQILFVPERLWILFCFWLSITRKGQSLSFCGRRERLP